MSQFEDFKIGKPYITTPSVTREILKKHNIHLTKRLGQHFLVDGNIIAKEIAAAGLTQSDTVLEVGPGIGALTTAIAKSAGRVIIVELDRRFIPVIQETLAGLRNVSVIQGNALNIDLNALGANKLVANPPYNIASPLIAKILTTAPGITEATIMVQKEVARRMTAPPGSDDYGPLAITIDAYAEAQILFTISPRSFLPPPRVESAVVALKKRPKPLYEENTADFLLFVRELFTQRRKMIKATLRSYRPEMTPRDIEAVITAAGLSPESRVEKLTPGELFTVYNA